jgi:hypothetical protein
MAQDPLLPRDDGQISLPAVDSAMNKLPPGSAEPPRGAKGERQESEQEKLRRETKEDAKKRQEDILATARKRFKRCVDAESDNRAKALDDLKFKAGDQWPEGLRKQREEDDRPVLTVNKIPAMTHQVTNDLRQNRPQIQVSPVGGRSDKEGAQAFAGMIRSIERDCAADIAYDTAITSAADIGFGYWRILTEYESEDSFNRSIVVRRVRNPFSVYLDPSRVEPDGCDAKFGFVTEMMDRAEFKAQFPQADMMPWTEKGVGDDHKEWVTKDSVRIAEYFCLEHEVRRLVQLSNGHVGFFDDLSPEVREEIEAGNLEILDERESECQRVVWHKITATQILETEPWAGRWIPIVEVIGEEIDLQGKVIRSGLIRNAKDPQRMKNYWVTAKAEHVALAPKTHFILAEGQDEGYEQEWKTANKKAMPALHYVPVALGETPVPPPQAVQSVGIAAGMVEAEKSAEQDMMATTGIRFDSTMAERTIDESGKAIRELRRNNDVGSFHYMDNASRSLRHTGRILVDLIPKIYDTRRVVTILRENDEEERLTLDPAMSAPMTRQPKSKDAASRKIFNPTLGKYGVTVTVGPSYATKRIEAADQMMQFARVMPEKGALIAHLIAKYSDWPGSDEIYRILVRAVPPNLLAPDMRDLPPQMQAFVQSLTQQVSRLMTERTQMLRDLTDQRADRALRKEKIDRDFEAKLTKVFADMKTKTRELDQDVLELAVNATNSLHGSMEPQPSLDPAAPVSTAPDPLRPNPQALPVSPV